MRVNWSHLTDVHARLAKQFKPDDPIVFHYTPIGHNKKKNTVKFKSFMKFFWSLYDTPRVTVPSVIVTDARTDRVIYKHQAASIVKEEKPEGDGNLVVSWNLLPKERRRVLMRVLLSQIRSTPV